MKHPSLWSKTSRFLFRTMLKCRRLLSSRTSQAFGIVDETLQTKIGHIYVINLSRQPSRLIQIQNELSRLLDHTGTPLWSITERYPAIDARHFLQDPVKDVDVDLIAGMLVNDLILGWVNGKYEIGPRALGNRSIIAAPFSESTKNRLNEIKQREQFRPIAPICLEEDALQWFGCDQPSPHMLYTYTANTDALAAVTHINKTARIQTVSSNSNNKLYNLLIGFKKLTGYGVLCNTSLNFNGKGFINNIHDLSVYTIKHNLDGFVADGQCYLLKSSKYYQKYLKKVVCVNGN